jgi:hypothetical protein
MRETEARRTTEEFASCLVAHDGGAIDCCRAGILDFAAMNGV